MIGIIDYGSGNIHAFQNIMRELKMEFKIISCRADLEENYNKLILPGVGAFDEAIDQLSKLDMINELNKKVLSEKIPILGVCVGMQIMGNSSEEGNLDGLGWIPGHVKSLSAIDENILIPHMGWNQVQQNTEHVLVQNIDLTTGFYFMHSYYFEVECDENSLLTTNYGKNFASAVFKENIFGVQFHPEKSHENGRTIIENFLKLPNA